MAALWPWFGGNLLADSASTKNVGPLPQPATVWGVKPARYGLEKPYFMVDNLSGMTQRSQTDSLRVTEIGGSAPFTEASHVIYDAPLDRLFVGGFNAEHPKDRTDHGGSVGAMLSGFADVRASKRLSKRIWQRDLPYEAGTVGLGGEVNNFFCASYAGDAQGGYLFIGGLSERGVKKISIWALDPKTGEMAQRFLPGPEVAGYCGWFDFNNAINAMKRNDGEYILFAEDDGAQKVNMFRWNSGLKIP